MMLHCCPVHWVSKLQDSVTCNVTEAEFVALSQAMKELLPMREFLAELQTNMELGSENAAAVKSTVFEDNNGALRMATSPKMSPRTEWIAIECHFFADQIGEEKGIVIEKIDTEKQTADIFTKGMEMGKFQSLRKMLCGW